MTVNDRALLLRYMQDDLVFFARYAFGVIRPGAALMHAWYVDALCHELDKLARVPARRLLINMPPRSLKSTLVSVIFTAWWLGHNPSSRFICASYNDSLARTFSRDFRRLVADPLFQEAFPAFRLDPRKNTETEVVTTQNGYRLATSVGGTLTGRGADLIIVDDPLNALEAYSAVVRARVNEWFDTALLSRLDNQTQSIIIVVMQRLHEDDLSGHLIEKGGWRQIRMPAHNFEGPRSIRISPNETYIWPHGADLMPQHLGRPAQDRLLADMGEAAFSVKMTCQLALH